MLVKGSRLGLLLRNAGFVVLAERPSPLHDLFLGRPYSEDLALQISVSASGRKGEAVYAYVGVTVIFGENATKGLIELDLLKEIASNKERAWTIIETREQAIAWEKSLARVAPARAEALARDKGPELLERTRDARDAAARYLGLLAPVADPSAVRSALERLSTAEQRETADRWTEYGAIQQMPNGTSAYYVSALAMLVHGEAVEGRPAPFARKKPIEEDALFWRIQLLVDLLFRQHGDVWRQAE
jgi:hypothetical protein